MGIKKGNKKGFNVSYWVLIEGLIISIAIVITFQFIYGVKDDTLFEQKFLARDLALMVNTVSTVPGDVIYTYNHNKANMSGFEYHFTKNLVEIKKPGSELFVTYPFYYDSSLSPNFQNILNTKQIMFAKRGALLEINKQISEQVRTEKCPTVVTKGTLKIVAIDSSDEAWEIADRIYKKSLSTPSAGFHLSLTRQRDPASIDDRLDRISEATDVVISIEVSDEDTIKAYASKNNFKNSDKLACLIIENLKNQFQPIPTYRLQSDERIINKYGAGVKIVVSKDKSQDKVAAAILSSLREYNE